MSNVIFDPERWESVEAGDEALIECWLVSEGDHVHAHQALAKATLVHELAPLLGLRATQRITLAQTIGVPGRGV
jgi:hypothetical protein